MFCNVKTVLMGAISGVLMLTGTSAWATPIFFTNQATFLTAAPSLDFEGFNAFFAGAPAVAFTGFSVSVGVGNVLSFTTPCSEGARCITDSLAANNTQTFSFNSPITAFGITILDFGTAGANTLSAFTDTGSFNQIFTGVVGSFFFGVIDMAPFSMLTITGTNGGDRLFYDELFFGTVPEPSTLAIFAFGLAGLGFFMRRRRTG